MKQAGTKRAVAASKLRRVINAEVASPENKSKQTATPAEEETGVIATKKAPNTCAKCARWKDVKRQMGIARLLGDAVHSFEQKLTAPEFTPTVAEYLKLVQIEQEYEKELNPPEEIRVTWIEPTTESENSK